MPASSSRCDIMNFMSSRGKKDAILIGLIVLLAFGTLFIWMRSGDTESSSARKVVASGEVVDGGYVKIGEVVEISGTVNGDVKVAGGQIIIDGQINGDLVAVGAFVSVSGKISGDARLIGGQIIQGGEVGGDVVIGGINVAVTNGALISGKLVGVGSNLTLAGLLVDDVKIGGRNLTITSTVDGNVEAAVESLRITSKSHITGDLTYWSNREMSIDENAVVRGETVRKAPQGFIVPIEALFGPLPVFLQPFLRFTSILITLTLGLLLITIFPGYTRRTVFTLRTKRFQCFTTGFMVLLLLPVAFGVLFITIVGIPLGFVLLVVSSVIFYVARIFVMLLIGRLLLERTKRELHEVWALVLGLTVYSFFVSLPYIGWAIAFLAVVAGLGAAIITLKSKTS